LSSPAPSPPELGTPSRVDSAVLVPLFRDSQGELRLALVRRAEFGLHGGQIAFPGGKRETGDRSLQETALRETQEEIGLPPSSVEILDRLPEVDTLTTAFRIVPFLARIVPPERWEIDPREIAEVLEVALADLSRPDAHGEEIRRFPTWPEPRRIAFYRIGPHKLWGATYRIVHPLLARLAGGEIAI
jgi:8-oxo-dGTP pyrophosphatase MutT (NUDIX family)